MVETFRNEPATIRRCDIQKIFRQSIYILNIFGLFLYDHSVCIGPTQKLPRMVCIYRKVVLSESVTSQQFQCVESKQVVWFLKLNQHKSVGQAKMFLKPWLIPFILIKPQNIFISVLKRFFFSREGSHNDLFSKRINNTVMFYGTCEVTLQSMDRAMNFPDLALTLGFLYPTTHTSRCLIIYCL